MPTRLRIRWDGDARLVLETDADRQVRTLDFGAFGDQCEDPRLLLGRVEANEATLALLTERLQGEGRWPETEAGT